jgi:L-asparaginase II
MGGFSGRSEHPIEVTVTRAGWADCRHFVDIVVADSNGSIVASRGDSDGPIFPRSAIKALQALPLVESGAADAFGFQQRHLALASASHAGDPVHVATALEMLDAAGNTVNDLECGTHPPHSEKARRDLAAKGVAPSAIHNNCSGKHAGFLAFASFEKYPKAGYVRREHPVQRAVADTLASVTGYRHEAGNAAIDGCSIPTFCIPLVSLAQGLARFATGAGVGAERAAAMARIREACIACPEMVQGEGGFDTKLMRAGSGTIFAKGGAEGVMVAALPGTGLGIALKCRDGAGRAGEVTLASVLQMLIPGEEPVTTSLKNMANPVLRNWNGLTTGGISVTGGL